MGIRTSFTLECDECMLCLYDADGDLIHQTTFGGMVRAAQRAGWWVVQNAEYYLCVDCRKEEGL